MLTFDLMHSYKAHSMGSNAISAVNTSNGSHSNKMLISICSGGDDQSLTYIQFSITQVNLHHNIRLLYINNLLLLI